MPLPPIEADHLSTCKIGQGNDTCRYLFFGPDGFGCGKHTELRQIVDRRVMLETMVARGDNCPGIEYLAIPENSIS